MKQKNYILYFLCTCLTITSTEYVFSQKNDRSNLVHNYNSDMANFYLKKAKLKKSEGDLDAAQAHFLKAQTFDAKLADSYAHLFQKTLTVQEWIKKAKNTVFTAEKIGCYKRALKSNPQSLQLNMELGKLLYKEKNYNEAKKLFLKVLAKNGQHVKAKKWLKKTEKKIAKNNRKKRS